MMKKRIVFIILAVWALLLSTFATAIETDRTWYLAGEQMKVSVTADDALIAYAELCDTHGLAAGVVVGLEEGRGTGIIELPSDLHSGYYVLSVYTNHNPNVTHRLVAIINPLHKGKADDMKWVSGDSCWVTADGTADLISEKRADMRETEGHIIKARIKNVSDSHAFSGNQICPSMSIIGVLSAMSSTDVSLPIEIISPFATLLPKKLPHLVFHYKRSEVEARSLDMQRHQKIKERDENQAIGRPLDYDETVFGTKPDLTYNLDEYRQFLSIREVLLEYVDCVKKIKQNDVSKLIVRRGQDHYNSSLPTLVLIDGMPVFDIERLLNYDARRIHYINIYGGQYTFGNGVYNGILSFITRSGQLTNYPTERNMQYLVYDFPE